MEGGGRSGEGERGGGVGDLCLELSFIMLIKSAIDKLCRFCRTFTYVTHACIRVMTTPEAVM